MDGTKRRTFRVLFIPSYEIGEIVYINFKTDGVKETLFKAKIISIYPKRLKDVDFEEAKLDGFDSVEEFREGIIKINKIKNPDKWGFFITFKRIKD